MLISRVNRTDAEKVFINVTNVSASSITQGYAAAMAVSGNSVNGNNAVLADAEVTGFIGIAKNDIIKNGVGLVQCWGYADSVFISNVGTSITINQGDPMVPGALAGGMFSAAPTYANAGLKYVLADQVPKAVSDPGVWMSGWVRAL